MKKIMLFFVACISCITVACDSDDDGTKGDDNKFPAPEVTFSAITGVSFTAGWNALFKYTIIPPAFGSDAPSSAKHNPPSRDTMPPIIQQTSAQPKLMLVLCNT